MKIVYVIGSLAWKGGAERILSEKMNYLSALDGYDITVITCCQFPQNEPNTYYLSDRVRQIDLAIPAYRQYKYGYPRRLWERRKYQRLLCQELEKAVNAIDPDILIGVAYILADVVCNIRCRAVKIIESHNNRQYALYSSRKTAPSIWSWLNKRLCRRGYLRTIEKRADIVVSLTQGEARDWRKAKRVEIIPNFSTMPVSKLSDGTSKRVIAVGRLEWQKGYDRLLQAWSLVNQKHPEWHLDIFGEGPLEEELKDQIIRAELDNVTIHPFTSDISLEYAASSICVLTSRFEGFSLVLLEALKHGVPCVTFDCSYGPAEVVDSQKCGFVVEDGDCNELAEKLCYLMDHPKVGRLFATAAVAKAGQYDIDTIMQQWTTLFESLTSQKL